MNLRSTSIAREPLHVAASHSIIACREKSVSFFISFAVAAVGLHDGTRGTFMPLHRGTVYGFANLPVRLIRMRYMTLVRSQQIKVHS